SWTGASPRIGGPCRCSTLRWCLKKETSLIVVSMRSTQPYLSYILIEELAKRCLMQVPSMVGRQPVGQILSALPVIDTNEGIVGGGEADAFCCQSTRQPAVTVAVELQAERCPCRHPQIDQAKLGIDEIEIVVETLAAVWPHEGLVRRLVVPRLVSAARLHRRDDMHQAGVFA